MARYQWNKNLFLVFLIAICAPLHSMEPEDNRPWYEVVSQTALIGLQMCLKQKDFDEAYELVNSTVYHLKTTPEAARWHNQRFLLFRQSFSSDASKHPAAIADALALLRAPANTVSMDSQCLALDFFQSQAIANDKTAFDALEECLQSGKQHPLLRFIACNHCITISFQGIPEAQERASQYFKVCPLLATNALPLIGHLDNNLQRTLIRSFLNNAAVYLKKRLVDAPKTPPEDKEMLTYRDLIISFFKNGTFRDNNEYGMSFLVALYDGASKKEDMCKFLFPLVNLFLTNSQWEESGGKGVKNTTHKIILQLMGLSYFHGAGIEQDYQKAANYFKRTLQESNHHHGVLIDSMYAFSVMQMGGNGCEKNLVAAETGFKQLSSQPSKKIAAQALYQLGRIKFAQSKFNLASTYFSQSRDLLLSLFNMPDHTPCDEEKKKLKILLLSTQHDLATSTFKEGRYEHALINYRKVVDMNCSDIPDAPPLGEFDCVQIGDMCAGGCGVKKSTELAWGWYSKAAKSSHHEPQRLALERIICGLSNPAVQPDESVRKMARWNKYTIGVVPLPTRWPALTATGTIDYETALVRLAELSLHRQPATDQSLNFAREYFSKASLLFYDILHRKNDTPEQAAELEPHRVKLQQLYTAALVGIGETSYQQRHYDDSKKYFTEAVVENRRPDLKGYAWLRLGDLYKNKLIPPIGQSSQEDAARYFYTKAAQQTDHLPSKKAAEERLKELQKP